MIGAAIQIKKYALLAAVKVRLLPTRYGTCASHATGMSNTMSVVMATYSERKHVGEQLGDRLLIVRPFETDPKLTFGVTPSFVRQSMDGYLPRTIVVIAGCSVLGRTDLAEALVSRGASVVISWDRSVGLTHADEATARLVTHLCAEGMTVEEAVVATMAEMGPDPDYGAILRYFPASVARRTADELLSQ